MMKKNQKENTNYIFYKGYMKDYKEFGDTLEDKYYGWKVRDVIKDLQTKKGGLNNE